MTFRFISFTWIEIKWTLCHSLTAHTCSPCVNIDIYEVQNIHFTTQFVWCSKWHFSIYCVPHSLTSNSIGHTQCTVLVSFVTKTEVNVVYYSVFVSFNFILLLLLFFRSRTLIPSNKADNNSAIFFRFNEINSYEY